VLFLVGGEVNSIIEHATIHNSDAKVERLKAA